ncbi:proteasome-type protease [Parahaliea aestuarii]|uniref:Proteasome-type protease n=1 Tax=Parahaliea aestuarii TaxID=1852021 RepID=A0A5C8ZLW2_9GAMM|nr:proteasome-type protease [Parahaliea aestuarii]TXS89165.1 proteasome-type protease [Parahaliea aestuarii]
MTYCLAIALDEGLVFCSDSRTNAGADRVSTYSKMHRFSVPYDRSLVLLSAGNLATSQAVVSQIQRDLEEDNGFNILEARYVSEIADYVGKLSVREQAKHSGDNAPLAGFDAGATFILGGQIKGHAPELYMIYPEGNHITASEQHPYLQIGETKYGKPILDRIIRRNTPYATAMRCALVSMDSTIRSNATVGPPLECLFYKTDSLQPQAQYFKLDEHHPYLALLRQSWDDNIRQAFDNLPSLNEVFAKEQ